MWCHVQDVVHAHIRAVDRGQAGENYLLGGTEAGFLDLVNEIEKLLGKKLSRSVQSKWLLKAMVFLLFVKSKLDGKEPALTPEKYNRASAAILCDYEKAVRVLNYQTSSLEKMIRDSYQWLKSENLL